jgi:hypothetical protein
MTGSRATPPEHEPWMDLAVCATTDPDLFFPEKDMPAEPAKRVCAGCPVAGKCLDYAIVNRIDHGVWGGKSVLERRRIGGGRGRHHNPGLVAAVERLVGAGLMDVEIAPLVGVSSTHVGRVRRRIQQRTA